MKLVFILCSFLSCQMLAQSLPEFKEKEGQLYRVMYNMVNISLNEADPSYIKLKSNGNRINKLNDSTYQVSFQNALSNDVKIKLYYKGLPVDVLKGELIQSPQLKLSLSNASDEKLSIEDFFTQTLKWELEDKNLIAQKFKFFSVNVNIHRNGRVVKNLLMLKNDHLSYLRRNKNQIRSGDKITFDQIKIVNGMNQRVECQSNYLEISIK